VGTVRVGAIRTSSLVVVSKPAIIGVFRHVWYDNGREVASSLRSSQ
jgi:hypothetical protein